MDFVTFIRRKGIRTNNILIDSAQIVARDVNMFDVFESFASGLVDNFIDCSVSVLVKSSFG